MAATETKRSKVVHVRLTPDENARLAAFCEARGLPVSEALRRLAREAGGLGPIMEGDDRAAIKALTGQMRAIGVNLNQALRALNMGHMPARDQLGPLLGKVIASLDEVDDLFVALCRRAVRRAAVAVGDERPQG
jgi:hypothetical protein